MEGPVQTVMRITGGFDGSVSVTR